MIRKVICFAVFLFVTGCTSTPVSQTEQPSINNTKLEFINEVSDCENEHVVFPPGNDGRYMFGYVYIDPTAGFTLHMEGVFSADDKGTFVLDDTGVNKAFSAKMRLQAGTKKVSRMPKKLMSTLGVESPPAWAEHYVDEADPFTHQIKWGTFYNHVGNSKKAVLFLETAYAERQDGESLLFELAFAYNALGRFDESIKVLNSAIELNPESLLFYKELGYAYISTKAFKKAINVYLDAFSKFDDGNPEILSEMALHTAKAYSAEKNKVKSDEWLNKAKSLAPEGSGIKRYLQQF